MFKFSEVQLLSPSINGRQELVFRVKVKPEDYTLEMFKELAEQFETISFACVLAPFQSEETVQDPLPKLRQQLAMVMKGYCEEGGYNEMEETNKLYKRNNIMSRMDLTKEQLETEVEKYRVGILEFNQ